MVHANVLLFSEPALKEPYTLIQIPYPIPEEPTAPKATRLAALHYWQLTIFAVKGPR